jgi:hypothetical protein
MAVAHKKTPQSGVFFAFPVRPGKQPAITCQQVQVQQQVLVQLGQQQELQQHQQQALQLEQQQVLVLQVQRLLLFYRKQTKQQQR